MEQVNCSLLDIVYTPELIDKKLLKTKRIINGTPSFNIDKLGTIDYVQIQDTSKIVLRIHPKEQSRLVLQIGSSDPQTALQACKLL
jgi:tRNA-dihydrouridine synthase 2